MSNQIVYRPPLDQAELNKALELRQEVFINEFARDRLIDSDEIDLTCHHIVAVQDDDVIGTLRLYELTPGDREIKIGRVAVRKELRGQGIGTELMATALSWAKSKYHSVYLYSQIDVVDFYKRLGYIEEGDIFLEAGTEHIVMTRGL
jgi:predicted GNAT family N-acyltransferase